MHIIAVWLHVLFWLCRLPRIGDGAVANTLPIQNAIADVVNANARAQHAHISLCDQSENRVLSSNIIHSTNPMYGNLYNKFMVIFSTFSCEIRRRFILSDSTWNLRVFDHFFSVVFYFSLILHAGSGNFFCFVSNPY